MAGESVCSSRPRGERAVRWFPTYVGVGLKDIAIAPMAGEHNDVEFTGRF